MTKPRNEIKDLRQFGIVLAGILLVFGFIHFLKGRAVLFRYFLGFGLVFLALSLAIPRSLKGVYAVFLKIAHMLGWFNTRVILIFIYYVVLTPIALVFRLSGKDLLNRKPDKNAKSYWIKRTVTKPLKEQLEKQF